MKRAALLISTLAVFALANWAFAQFQVSDSPFSDAIARSNALVFDVAHYVTLNGTITGEVVHINRGPAYYFRIDVTDDNRTASVWAVLVRVNSPQDLVQLKSGVTVRVRGNRAKDGSHRLVSAPDSITVTSR
jgi:hypothetical protein